MPSICRSRRRLFSTVALTTAVQMAAAAERAKLPTAMLGHWCGETDDLGSITFKRKKCPDSDGFLIMKADGYRGHETDCKTLNTVFLRRVGTVPHTYVVDYQCAGEGETRQERHIMFFSGEQFRMIRVPDR